MPGSLDGNRTKFSILITGQLSGLMPDPDRAFRIFKQAGHVRAGHLRRVASVKNREMHTIEPRQTAVRAHPQITIV